MQTQNGSQNGYGEVYQTSGSRAANAAPKQVKRQKLVTFAYSSTGPDGKTKRGTVQAYTVEQVKALIAGEGRTPVKIRKTVELELDFIGGSVKRRELIVFSRQLATFVKAGVPMVDALASIGGDNASRNLQSCLREVSLSLARGLPLSTAMADHPKVFPKFYVDLIRAGEITGNIDQILRQAAAYMARQEDMKRKIKQALSYPAVVGMMAVMTIAIMAIYVLPNFVTFFQQFGAKLPLPTRILINVTTFLTNYWGAILFGIGLILVTIALSNQIMAVREIRDRIVYNMPLVGPVIKYANVEKFCTTLATMVRAGVPFVTTFQVVVDSAKNRVVHHALEDVRDAMLTGQGVAAPLAATGVFPGMVSQMVKVGEDTGTLDEQLTMAADFYAEELEVTLSKFTAIFEPAVIVLMGTLVGFVGLALVSAMYGIYTQVQKGAL